MNDGDVRLPVEDGKGIPRMTPEVDSTAIQHAWSKHSVIVIIAYALFLALNSFTLWSLSVFMDGGVLGQDAQMPLSLSCFIGNALSFFVIAVLASRVPRARKPPFRVAVAGLVLGFAILIVCYLLKLHLAVAFVIAGLAIGTGSTCCFFCFSTILFAEKPGMAKIEVLLGSALMILPSVLFGLIPAGRILLALAFILMPACLIALRFALATDVAEGVASVAGGDVDDAPVADAEGAATAAAADSVDVVGSTGAGSSACSHGLRDTLKELWPSLLCLAMIAIVCPTVNVVSTLATTSTLSMYLLAWGDSLASVGILAIVWFVAKRHLTIASLYLVVVPIVATTFLLWPFLGENFGFVLMAVGVAGYCLISVVAVISSLEMTAERGLCLYLVFGVVMGTLYSTRILGTLLGNMVKAAGFSEQLQVAAIAFLLLYGFSIVGFIVLRNGRRAAQLAASEAEAEAQAAESQVAAVTAEKAELQSVDMVAVRCAAVAKKYSLSERSAQVMELLVRGRSVPMIAKTLYLSENTVRTHTKRVYSALDVHTRQELLDLVEAIEVNQ